MPHITLEPATTLSARELTTLLNRAFTGYIVPVQFSAEALEGMIERDDILLDASFVARDAGAPVGLALVAVRPGHGGTRTRLAAMGVTPEGRRRGVGRALLRHVITGAEERGSAHLTLEVFANNTAARRLYEAHGFIAVRRLLGFTLPGAALRARRGAEVALRPLEGPAALPLFAACASGAMPAAAPAWQVEAPALARLRAPTRLYAVEAPLSSTTAGYLALRPGRPSGALLHLAILPRWRRRGLATTALRAVLEAHPEIKELAVPALAPEASMLVPFFAACGGVRDQEEQLEMLLDLS